MPESNVILCEDCAREKAVMQGAGNKRFISCEAIPGRPGFCDLRFEYVFLTRKTEPPTGNAGQGGSGN